MFIVEVVLLAVKSFILSSNLTLITSVTHLASKTFGSFILKWRVFQKVAP